jgi:hypothetical protein
MEKSLLMLVLGIIFLAGGIFLWLRTSARRKTMKPHKAVITKIESHSKLTTNSDGEEETETSRTVHIAYDYDGRRYERELNYYSIGMREGREIEIFIDPRDPSKISSRGDRAASLILAVMGAILLFVGLYSFMEA